ncbi:MAG: hypothetical protein ACRENT_05500 [Thermodesulfobacteriota bacterium]
MPYQLILSERVGGDVYKDVGENVFIDNLPADCEVYLLYYPGAMPNEEVEAKLRALGEMTGKNLFVNIGRLNDPNFKKIAGAFDIKKLPAIAITADAKFASPPNEFLTAYVRIDDKKFLSSPNELIACIEALFNLFIQGEVSEAIREFEKAKRDKFISDVKGVVLGALKGVAAYLEKLEITVSLLEGKLELKKSGE